MPVTVPAEVVRLFALATIVTLAEYVSRSLEQMVPSMVKAGIGLTVMRKFSGAPKHPFSTGVTTMLEVNAAFPGLTLVKLMFPLPLAPKPVLVLELVQSKLAPLVPVKLAVTVAPAQTAILAGTVTFGAGLTVMVKFCVAPAQPIDVGVTAILASVGALTLAAVKLMLPVPVAPSPMVVFELVQSKAGAPVPVKLTVTGAPAHTISFAGAAIVGTIFTSMVNVINGPLQPFKVGSTAMVALIPVNKAVKLMFPVPLAPSPTPVLSLVQFKMAEGVPTKSTATAAPSHTEKSGICITDGTILTVKVTKIRVELTQLVAMSRASA